MLMNYANGQSAAVPAYIALSELNRRKILKETEAAQQQAPQQSVKDQLLTGQAQQMQNATPGGGMPPQLSNPVEQPQPQPQPMQMAEGGLASVPLDMFKRSNFAPGGIVAFNGEDNDQLVESKEEMLIDALNELRGGGGKDTLSEKKEPLSNTQSGLRPEDFFRLTMGKPEKAQESKVKTFPQATSQGLPSLSSLDRANPYKDLPKDLTDEEAFKQHAALKKMMGISDDPYAETKAMRKELEKMQEARRANEPYERLMAIFSGDHPSGNFFMGLGAGADKAAELKKLQMAQREKDFEHKIELAKLDAQEAEAVKKGNMDAVLKIRADRKAEIQQARKNQMDFDQVSAQMGSARASERQAGAAETNAKTNQMQEERAVRNEALNQDLLRSQIEENRAQAASQRAQAAREGKDPENIRAADRLFKEDPSKPWGQHYLSVVGSRRGDPLARENNLSLQEADKILAGPTELSKLKWSKLSEEEKNRQRRALMEQNNQGLPSVAAPSAGPRTATNPQTGQKVQQLSNGQWVPVGR